MRFIQSQSGGGADSVDGKILRASPIRVELEQPNAEFSRNSPLLPLGTDCIVFDWIFYPLAVDACIATRHNCLAA
jgi:hypothetical protein